MAKNAIKKALDEMSLDFANGKYLNVISANYGIIRPVSGFDDDTWRAVTKIVALQYKQIYSKFVDILTAVLGPQKTIVTNLVTPAVIGSKTLVVNDSSRLPQVGTLVLDRGTPNEEVISYRYIDYSSGTVFLKSTIQFNHDAFPTDARTYGLLCSSGKVLCVSTTQFPSSGPYSITVGLGTASEESVTLLSNNIDSSLLNVSALSNSHSTIQPSLRSSNLSQPYAKGSFYLTIVDTAALPEQGVVLLGNSSNSFIATAVSGLTLFTGADFGNTGSLCGYRAVFTGNVTPSLAGIEATIINSSSNSFTLVAAPASPAVGDSFYLRPVAEYTSKSELSSSIVLRKTIPSSIQLGYSTKVELLENTIPVALSTVSVVGTEWDISQPGPNLVEITIPFDSDQLQSLRSASYMHRDSLYTGTTNLTSSTAAGDTELKVASTSSFSDTGTLAIGANYYFFIKRTATTFRIPNGLLAHASGAAISEVGSSYASSDLPDGNYNVNLAWQGPYSYGEEHSIKYNARTVLAQNLAAPSVLALDIQPGAGPKAVEVENASLFPLSGSFSLRVGTEAMTATAVTLKSRAASKLSGAHAAGITTLTVTAGSLNPGVQNANWPAASGYRILVGRGTANVEICYVTGINTGSNTVAIQSPTQYSHSSLDAVELLRDTVTVAQVDSLHTGLTSYSFRAPVTTTPIPEAELPAYNRNAEPVSVIYSSVDVINAVNFPATDGEVILSFGDNKSTIVSTVASVVASGTATLVLQDTSKFPSSSFFVEIDAGTRYKEVFEITSNNTGTNTLTVFNASGYGVTKYSHSVGAEVRYIGSHKETLTYNTRSGNTLYFASPITVSYNHLINDDISVANAINPLRTGYDFPLRIAPDYFERLQYLINLVRAAGVAVVFNRQG